MHSSTVFHTHTRKLIMSPPEHEQARHTALNMLKSRPNKDYVFILLFNYLYKMADKLVLKLS